MTVRTWTARKAGLTESRTSSVEPRPRPARLIFGTLEHDAISQPEARRQSTGRDPEGRARVELWRGPVFPGLAG